MAHTQPRIEFRSRLLDDTISEQYREAVTAALASDKAVLWIATVEPDEGTVSVRLTRPSGTTFEGTLNDGQVDVRAWVAEEWFVDGIKSPADAAAVLRDLLVMRADRKSVAEAYRRELH